MVASQHNGHPAGGDPVGDHIQLSLILRVSDLDIGIPEQLLVGDAGARFAEDPGPCAFDGASSPRQETRARASGEMVPVNVERLAASMVSIMPARPPVQVEWEAEASAEGGLEVLG